MCEVYGYTLGSTDKTVKVSRQTLSQLERLRDEMKAASIHETETILIRNHLRRIPAGAFGADEGKMKPFDEKDRGEDR